jgi:hypothetical protein
MQVAERISLAILGVMLAALPIATVGFLAHAS